MSVGSLAVAVIDTVLTGAAPASATSKVTEPVANGAMGPIGCVTPEGNVTVPGPVRVTVVAESVPAPMFFTVTVTRPVSPLSRNGSASQYRPEAPSKVTAVISRLLPVAVLSVTPMLVVPKRSPVYCGEEAGAAGREALHALREVGGIVRRHGREQRIACLGEHRVHRRELVGRDDVALHAVLRLREREAPRVAQQVRVAAPQHRGPHFARVVHLGGVAVEGRRRRDRQRRGGLDVTERQGILGEIARVRVAAHAEVIGGALGDAADLRSVGNIAADGVGAVEVRIRGHQRVLRMHHHEQRMEVRPTLAQALGLLGRDAVRIADEAVADVVAPLVGDDGVVHRAVAIHAEDVQQVRAGRTEAIAVLMLAPSVFDTLTVGMVIGVTTVASGPMATTPCDSVHNDDAHRAGNLGGEHLALEAACAAVDHRDQPRDGDRHRGAAAVVGG